MLKSNPIIASLKVAAIAIVVAVAAGCVSAKSRPTAVATPATTPESASAYTPSATSALTRWVVAAGQHLWGIAGEAEVYDAAEQWPLLYRNNIAQIDDADLIYPGQVLDIPRNLTAREINAAVKHAKNRGAWSVGAVELSDREYLKDAF